MKRSFPHSHRIRPYPVLDGSLVFQKKYPLKSCWKWAFSKRLQKDPGVAPPHTKITNCIEETVTKFNQAEQWHRAAIALPRPLAQLIQHRQDLVALLCNAFLEHIHDATPKQSKFSMATEEEWIWTTHAFGPTSYAMLRSSVAPPDWKTQNSIPSRYQSAQMKRLQRQGQNQATPHLLHGLQLGVRLVAGVDALFRSNETRKKQSLRQQEDPATNNVET